MDMTHVPHSPEIDICGLVDAEFAGDVSLANEIIKNVFDDKYGLHTKPHADLPIFWRAHGGGDGSGDTPVSDPATIDISMHLAGYDDPVVYRTTLSAMVDEAIDNAGGSFIDERAEAEELAAALRALADKIEAAIAR